MKPMLAHKFRDHGHKLTYPCYVQPKLNGVRMLYRDDQCQSRDEHWWQDSMLRPIRDQLIDISTDFILDGELYKHGWSLQEINGAASVNRKEPNAKTALIEYHVFDCIIVSDPTLDFVSRWWLLMNALGDWDKLTHVKIVPTIQIQDDNEGESQYSVFRKQRYEGMMYRQAHSPYGLASQCTNQENRWTCLQKRKEWMDAEGPVVDINEGEGKYAGMVGSLVVQVEPGKTVDIGSGLSDLQRTEFYSNPPIDFLCRYRFEMYSDGGIPLKPQFEAILD